MPSILPASSSRRRVALLVLNASDWSRQIHDGIAAFAREQGHWNFWLQPRGTRDRVPMRADWSGDGIICRLAEPELRAELLELGLPTVNVSWHGEHTSQIPKVMSDLAGCGRLCAQFFLDRGFQSFAYLGPQRYLGYADGALDASREEIEAHGHTLSVFEQDPDVSSPDMDFHREAIGRWIESLPKPVSITCWSSIVAREAVIASLERNLKVPEEVAVLAIEHDSMLSALSPVPISYVLQRPQVVGYMAAELLEKLMAGEAAPEKPILVAPEGIAECLSTDTRFGSDEIVNQAISYIRSHVHEAIQVSDLTRSLHISRRSMEERFRKVLNRTPADEIRLARLHHLKNLLRDTTLSLSAVAHKAGFSYQEVMIRFFKRETGQTPGDYRRYTVERAYRPGATVGGVLR